MRIACVHVPQLSLQCVTRVEPALRGAALAVAGSRLAEPAAERWARLALTAPVVIAVSRAAWSLGVRLGMTAVAARASVPTCGSFMLILRRSASSSAAWPTLC